MSLDNKTTIRGEGDVVQSIDALDIVNKKHADIVDEAKFATDSELQMSLWQGFKLYPKACAWSIVLSMAVIMEGFNTGLLGSFYAYPTFTKNYGHQVPGKSSYTISASWQTGLSDAAVGGYVIGLFINGWASERFGYKKTMVASLVAITGIIFMQFFAPSIRVLCGAYILIGIPLGVFQTLTTTYASEVCPVVLRGYLTSWVNICWFIGSLIAQGALRGFLARTDQWSYRLPFALQWMWPVPITIAVLLAPESPWWLVRNGRTKEAEVAVSRLVSRSADPNFNAEATVAMMVHTDAIEKETMKDATWLDCFRGVNLRRTGLVCGVYAIQRLCGTGLTSYSTYFFEQAGLSTANSFDMSIGQASISTVGSLIAFVLMSYAGRRSLFTYGLFIQAIILLVVGFVGLAPTSSTGASWAIGALILVFQCTYGIAVGPITYAIVTELTAVRLRSKSVVLARATYEVMTLINGVITPRMINPTAWNWGAKAGFFWGGVCVLCTTWAYFYLPESKGRTFAELDALFERGTSARKFASTKVDLFYQARSEDEKDLSVEKTLPAKVSEVMA